ncbi:unnamed protein product [Vitrella brassicaformis CCMP3155]|uniref:Ketoreductase (KR) domain-containing protein n=1 Tax=Vitrella brassicaformis (strain CCMP3155) TaxID=1169540 RepID=A0A0G4GJG6_VITBC|nr:unnamed protein product [Vitrella brassicaformis CCMP3155]|eukprot:CEM30058.1 unnamed protein product [Vitrella brassicaformis CCMP3155]
MVVVASRDRQRCQEEVRHLNDDVRPSRHALPEGRYAMAVECDVGKPGDLERTFDEAIERFGRVDVIVNNAGTAERADLLESEPGEFERVMRVNTTAVLTSTQLAIKDYLRNRRPDKPLVIINISSCYSAPADHFVAGGSLPAYFASKCAVNSLIWSTLQYVTSESFRSKYPNHPVLVYGIAPFGFESDMLVDDAKQDGFETTQEWAYANNPSRQLGDPMLIGELVCKLISDEKPYPNGEILLIDGDNSIDRLQDYYWTPKPKAPESK